MDQRTARVSSTALRTADYSVPTAYGFREVIVKGFVDEVVIICAGEEIARHKRSYERGGFVCDPLHYLALIEQKPGALDQARPLQDWALPEQFLQLRRLLEARMGARGKREFIQVLRLMETFDQNLVANAVKDALKLGARLNGRPGFNVLPLSGSDHFVLCNRLCVKEGLHWGFAEAPASLMGPVSIELFEPPIEIGLQLCDRAVKLFAEGDAVELVQHGPVEPLDDAIGLRAFGFRAGVIDVLNGKIELVFVVLGIAAIFGAAIGQHALQLDAFFVEEGDDAVVQQIGGGERRLAIVELGEGDFRVGVDEGLLTDAAHALHVADVEGILGAAIAGMLAFELAMGFFFGFGFLQGRKLGLGEDDASWATLASRAFRRFFIVSRSWRCHTQRTPAGDTVSPRFLSSLAIRTCPKAGCSMASATMAVSISSATRFLSTGFCLEISVSAISPPLSYSSLNR